MFVILASFRRLQISGAMKCAMCVVGMKGKEEKGERWMVEMKRKEEKGEKGRKGWEGGPNHKRKKGEERRERGSGESSTRTPCYSTCGSVVFRRHTRCFMANRLPSTNSTPNIGEFDFDFTKPTPEGATGLASNHQNLK
ncbi:hypothetical protein COP2_000047 [Malus domestica]